MLRLLGHALSLGWRLEGCWARSTCRVRDMAGAPHLSPTCPFPSARRPAAHLLS